MNLFLKILTGILLFFAPFSFAAAEPWSFSVLQGGILTGVLLLVFSRREIVVTPPLKWLALTGAFVVAYTCLQCAFTQTLLDTPAWHPATLARLYSLEHVCLFVTYILLLFLTANVWQSFRDSRQLLLLIVLCGFAVGLCALGLQKGEYIRFFTGVKGGFGPFLNRNHAGMFLTLCALGTLGYAWTAWKAPRPLYARRKGELFLRLGFLALVFAGLCALTVATRSRGGMLSLAAGLFAYAFLCTGFIPQNPKTRLKGLLLTVGVLLVTAALVWANKDAINAFAGRVSPVSVEIRQMLYAAAWDMIQIYPWWGIGVGAMPVAITSFMAHPLNEYVERLHCDWLEMWLGLGTVGFAVALAGAGISLWLLLRRMKRLETQKQFLFAALLSAVLAMCIGSGVDFHFFIPANAFLFFVLLGLACAPSYHKGHVHSIRAGLGLKIALCILCAAVFYLPAQKTIAWRLFLFGKGLNPQSRIVYYERALSHYPSPRYALRTGLAYYNYARQASDKEEARLYYQKALDVAVYYLRQYPQEKELSQLYMRAYYRLRETT